MYTNNLQDSIKMSEEEDDSEENYIDRFLSVSEVSSEDMKELGVNPLGGDFVEKPRLMVKRVNVGGKFKICDKINDDVCEKRPKLISPNKFLYRRKIHTINYNNTDLHLSSLPDEILLSIVQYLSHKNLCQLSEVSRRLYTVATDESLWQRIDLAGRKLSTNWIMHILRRGIRVARLTSAEVASPLMSPPLALELINFQSKLEYLDLSEVVITTEDLELLLSKCRMLRKLSLEACELSEGVCKEIAENLNIDTLNLCMCSGITSIGIFSIMINCQCLESLNISWTSLDKATIQELVSNITPSIRRLNLSGQRQKLKDRHILTLASRCPEIVELDVSDCLELTSLIISFISHNLFKLKSLSINRCYRIIPQSLSELTSLRHFTRLNASRLVTADLVAREGILPDVIINKEYLSTIARPTVGARKTSIWQMRCRD